MGKYLLARIGALLLVMWIASLIIFTLCEVLPIDPARQALGQFATEQAIQNLREELGLNRPPWTRYVDWIGGIVLHGDFGMSIFYRRPVSSLLGVRLKRTLTLAGFGFFFMIPLGIVGGILAGIFQDTILDRLLTILASIMVSSPPFINGIFLILVFSVWLRWFPSMGSLSKGANPFTIHNLLRLALPILTLALGEIGYLIRIVRVSLTDVLGSDYVRTAVLKGISKGKLIWRHVLRNALIGPVTLIILHINWLIGGVVVVEVLFNYHGLGQLILTAAQRNDVIVLESTTLIMVMVAVLTQVLGDIVLYFMNPRIRFD